MDCEKDSCPMEPRIQALEDWKSESKRFHNTLRCAPPPSERRPEPWLIWAR